ncbi:hypothetical protein GYMLUDRAFT_77721 [Collybiopsis luxurians FD-317 M1]|uniref:Fungal N-terminal domain-containing protein n=1 Tax=Collybiopsis luxurians FD-317 M1 TaxID=944289 RepID=A0A0D0BDS4_9AGAR|nr:hypothetical protein GYMLUDRAFT_77721 [Collybiopsis luxurians FD-317 M1]
MSSHSLSGLDLPLVKSPNFSSSGAWDVSAQAMELLAHTARVAPIPLIGTLSSLALSILKAIRNAQDNKDAFKILGYSAFSLALAVKNTYDALRFSGETKSDLELQSLYQDVKGLVATFKEILQFIYERRSRGLFKRTLLPRADSRQIRRYENKLQNALNVFSVKSNINIRHTLSKVASQQDELASLQRTLVYQHHALASQQGELATLQRTLVSQQQTLTSQQQALVVLASFELLIHCHQHHRL